MTYSEDSKPPTTLLAAESVQRHKWNKKRGLHRWTLFVATVLVISFGGILLSLRCIYRDYDESIPRHRNDITSDKPKFDSLESVQCSAVCASKDCIKTAALMLKMMDSTVDPCHDFYSYACGGYEKVVMGSKKKEFIINDIGEEILKPLKIMIEKLPRSVLEGSPGTCFAKIRMFYESCMNLRTSEEVAIPTALRYLEYFGIRNWPNLSYDYSFTNPDLDEALVRLSLYHTFLFFSLTNFSDEDEDNIQPPAARLPSESGNEFKVKVPFLYSQILHVDGYVPEETKNIIKATMEYFQLSESLSHEIIADVMSFDLQIYNITQETNLRKEQCQMNDTISCSRYYYDCTEEERPHTNRWCKTVRKLLSDCGFTQKYTHIRIVLEDGKHFNDLGELIDRTSQRTIAHALALRFFVDNAINMNYYLRRRASHHNVFSKRLEEIPESPSLYCTAWVSRRLPILMGTAFYSKVYKSEIHEEVKEIYSDIQESLISIVEDMPWVDREMKTSLKEIVSNITLSGYAYAQYVWNVSATDEFSENLQITEDSFLANNLEAKKFSIVTAIKVLDNLTEMEFLTRYPFELDPTISQLIINFEIGSFLFPLVAVERSRYSNLGSFGAILGHELSHKLESGMGEHENKSENFEREFEEGKKCLSEHYSGYEIDLIGEKVDGNDTFSENFADYFGFRAIFKSLIKYQEKRGFVERLPGLPFDNEQLLFVSFAQLWCETNTLESLKHYTVDTHSPAKVRVWGVYKNFEPFSEAFSCPLGSPMNPITKCNFEF